MPNAATGSSDTNPTGSTGDATDTASEASDGDGVDSTGDATEGTDPGSDGGNGDACTPTSPSGRSQDCTAANPFCVDGQCGGCDLVEDGDASCQLEDAAGCNLETGSCYGCDSHDDCPGLAACNFFTGHCLNQVTYVGGEGTPSFGSIRAAVDRIPVFGRGTIVVAAGDYDERPVFDGKAVALVADPDAATPPRLTYSEQLGSQLRVVEGDLIVNGLEVSNNGANTSPAVTLINARAWIERARITGNDSTGGAIQAHQSSLLVVQNSMVADDSGYSPIGVYNTSNATVRYSTIVARSGMIPAIECQAGSELNLRNSIVGSVELAGDAIDCSGTIVDNAVDGDAGPDNTNVGEVDPAWFVDYASNDLLLSPLGATVFAGTAVWHSGDPTTDIDIDARPDVDGTPDFAGADVPTR
ncbi:MAG: right-handed parallel beta-helix repeat-containing protein [Myxococcota bacterium]